MCHSLVHFGQDISELQTLNGKAKTIYIKAEALDQIMVALRPFENKHGNGIDTLLMDTYKVVAKGYEDNNHFKQGFEVYNKYLNYKIESLQLYKNKEVSTAVSSIDTRKKNDNSSQLDLQNKIDELQIDIDQLSSKQSSFKKYFSFGIILLSVVIAMMLVNYAVKFNSLKNKIKENKESMLKDHHSGTLGQFSNGYLINTAKEFVNVENVIMQIKSELKNTSDPELKKVDQLCSSILKSTSELKTVGL